MKLTYSYWDGTLTTWFFSVYLQCETIGVGDILPYDSALILGNFLFVSLRILRHKHDYRVLQVYNI